MAITKASLIDLNGQELILDADADTSITADTDDRIDFKTGGTDRVHITSAGHLSTGATSITNGGGYNKVIQVSGTEGCFSAISGSNEGLFAQNGVNTQVINRANGYMEFRANNTEYFRIAAGQIDVKSADLTMDDNRSLYIGDGNDLRLYHDGSTSYITDTSSAALVINGGNSGGVKLQAGSNSSHNSLNVTDKNGNSLFRVQGDGDYYHAGSAISDRNLKENIVDVSDGSLELVKQLKPRTFNFKSSEDFDGSSRTGFIAQEVADVMTTKHRVASGKDGENYMGIDPVGLIAHLTKAIQELEARLKTLEDS